MTRFPFFLWLAGSAWAANVNSHAPVSITSDADFTNCKCVTGGAGTTASPFIIGPWSINKVDGAAISIDGTNLTKSFTILNLTVAGNGSNLATGIVLQNINPGGTRSIVAAVRGKQTTIQAVNIGITVTNSSYVTLDGAGENTNGPGIAYTGAGSINHNLSGAIDIENSSHITVTGWQFSSNGQDHNPDWITLDPGIEHWGVGGVRFFGVSGSIIDHNAANNCTSVSFSLFNSSYNMVSNNTADYPFTLNFLVTGGSSYNMLSGNLASTADFIGYMVADPLPGSLATASHDNMLVGNISHTDGPTGGEIRASEAPAFLGGFVVLNGAYNNTLENNQDWASTGAGFVWAQAVPDTTSPIGVKAYPPLIHCNVTTSEGGGGVGNRNGNVWTGNLYQTIDPCLPPQ